jgi:hypothetical protein
MPEVTEEGRTIQLYLASGYLRDREGSSIPDALFDLLLANEPTFIVPVTFNVPISVFIALIVLLRATNFNLLEAPLRQD